MARFSDFEINRHWDRNSDFSSAVSCFAAKHWEFLLLQILRGSWAERAEPVRSWFYRPIQPKKFSPQKSILQSFFYKCKIFRQREAYTCKVALLNWVSLFRGLAWRGTAIRRYSEGPHWRAWVFCAHAVFLVAPPSSSQAAKVKETLKNLEWIGNLTRFNLTIFFSSKYCSDKSQPISVNCSEIRKFVNWKQI